MQEILKVNPETLLAKANEISTEKNNINGTLEEIKSQLKSLPAGWKSEGSDTFQNKFNQTYDDIESVLLIITEHISDLTEISNLYRTAESTTKAKSESLPTDGVFRN